MKRAKIMLMTIAVFATVGTALAFKVAKKGQTTYCYLQTNVAPGSGQGVCPSRAVKAIANEGSTVQYYYTTLTATNCANQSDCINQANNFTLE